MTEKREWRRGGDERELIAADRTVTAACPYSFIQDSTTLTACRYLRVILTEKADCLLDIPPKKYAGILRQNNQITVVFENANVIPLFIQITVKLIPFQAWYGDGILKNREPITIRKKCGPNSLIESGVMRGKVQIFSIYLLRTVRQCVRVQRISCTQTN